MITYICFRDRDISSSCKTEQQQSEQENLFFWNPNVYTSL